MAGTGHNREGGQAPDGTRSPGAGQPRDKARAQRPLFGGSTDPRRYDDIAGLDRPAARAHPPMAMEARAAQFAPFAALSGYENVIRDAREQHLLAGDGMEAVPVREPEES